MFIVMYNVLCVLIDYESLQDDRCYYYFTLRTRPPFSVRFPRRDFFHFGLFSFVGEGRSLPILFVSISTCITGLQTHHVYRIDVISYWALEPMTTTVIARFIILYTNTYSIYFYSQSFDWFASARALRDRRLLVILLNLSTGNDNNILYR